MAATERSFSEFPPSRLFLDTNVILDYLIPTRPHHGRVVPFLQKVQEIGITRIYISALGWIEFGHVVKRQDFRDGLPDEWKQSLRFDRWNDAEVRKGYLHHMCQLMEDFLGAFEWAEVSLTPTVRQAALSCMAEYKLDAQDAVHLASAFHAEVLDLASFDKGFRRVDDLYLWNDLIHSQRVEPMP